MFAVDLFMQNWTDLNAHDVKKLILVHLIEKFLACSTAVRMQLVPDIHLSVL